MEALKHLPPIPKNQPFTTLVKTLEKIKQLALLHPSKGCKYLEHLLALQGTRVSSVTIHKHLDQAGLAKKYDRWLALEQLGAESTQKQANELPSWKRVMRNLGKAMCSAPGELLNQDTFYLGRLKGVGKVYLHAMVDTHSSLCLRFSTLQ